MKIWVILLVNKMNDLKKNRTRWQRWLGQKCRKDKPYWTTLYNSNLHGWASNILDRYEALAPLKSSVNYPNREQIKKHFKIAIEYADMKDFIALDNLYCLEKMR